MLSLSADGSIAIARPYSNIQIEASTDEVLGERSLGVMPLHHAVGMRSRLRSSVRQLPSCLLGRVWSTHSVSQESDVRIGSILLKKSVGGHCEIFSAS